MAEEPFGSFENLARDAKRYADLKLEEFKLKSVRGLSTALSRLLSLLLIFALLSIVLGLLAYGLLQWLNALVGAPWGTMMVLAVFLLALVVLIIYRKRLFRDMFVRLFIDVFYDSEDDGKAL